MNAVLQAAQSWNLGDHLMGHVRTLMRGDIPAVARLYTRVYGEKYAGRQEQLQQGLELVLLGHPWYDERYPSLVYEDNQGDIVGCLGVLPRPMLFKGAHITAAVTHSFMVAPGSRATMAALHLAKYFFTGIQDLSLADGNNSSRMIWEICGGSASLLYSLCWTRPLRPVRYALSFMGNHGVPRSFTQLLRPLAAGADALMARTASGRFRFQEPPGTTEDLNPSVFAAHLPLLTRGLALSPEYDAQSAEWLMRTLENNTHYGRLHKVLVRNQKQRLLGWYLYHLKPSRIAEVVHVAAEKNAVGTVLDHLFFHAWREGALSLSGQFDPALFGGLSDRGCMFHHRSGANSWMVLYSRHPELTQAICAGDVFLSRMEGEWWISTILG